MASIDTTLVFAKFPEIWHVFSRFKVSSGVKMCIETFSFVIPRGVIGGYKSFKEIHRL